MPSIFPSVTTSRAFLPCNTDQTLFSVNPGVPALDALQMVQCFLDDALTVMDKEEETNFAVHRLVTLAKAVLDATVSGVPESEPVKPVAVDVPQGKYRYLDVISKVHQLHRDGVLVISPDASDLDEAEALCVFDMARMIACGGEA